MTSISLSSLTQSQTSSTSNNSSSSKIQTLQKQLTTLAKRTRYRAKNGFNN